MQMAISQVRVQTPKSVFLSLTGKVKINLLNPITLSPYPTLIAVITKTKVRSIYCCRSVEVEDIVMAVVFFFTLFLPFFF